MLPACKIVTHMAMMMMQCYLLRGQNRVLKQLQRIAHCQTGTDQCMAILELVVLDIVHLPESQLVHSQAPR